MAALSDATTGWFSQHIVTLEMNYTVRHKKKPPEENRCYYTGFLLYENGATFWVTAGHCMEQIENDILRNPQSYENVKFRLVDTFHSAVVRQEIASFDYVSEKHKGYFFHRSEEGIELGWDFGVVALHPHYVRQLATNNIVPIEALNWINVPETFDQYYMLGLPNERVRRLENGVYSARPAMFSMTRLHDRPACFAEQTDPMFYASIDPDSNVENIVGMSGGPIFGMKLIQQPPKVQYWVIAIQSKRKQHRIIAASPLAELRGPLSRILNGTGGDKEYGGNCP